MELDENLQQQAMRLKIAVFNEEERGGEKKRKANFFYFL
jgi:hypothetical protein